jgi:type I restriction enzyme, S subunit
MRGWKEHKLDELGKVARGKSKHRPRNDSSLYDGKYPFIQTGDIKAANFYITEYSQTYNDKGLKQSKLWEKGTLCITIAANIAETAILGIDACFPDSIIGFVANETKCDVKFIKYHFDLLKLHIQSISQGTTQDNLSQDKLLKFNFSLPEDLDHQKVIADILSAYDELIEVNNQRIKLLEETASELYKEWFVRMRFPGYKQAKFVKRLPEDWKVRSIGEVVDYNIGGGWGNEIATTEFNTPGYVIRGTDIPKAKVGHVNKEVYRFHKTSNMKSRQLIEGDIVFETAGGSEGQPLGRTCYITQELLDAYGDKVMAASFCKQIRTTSIPSLYLYYFLNYLYDTGMIETFQIQSTGISNYQFEAFLKFQQIVLPGNELMHTFHNQILLMQRQIIVLGCKNTGLRQIRDRLLPRLISGRLSVKNMATTAE